MAKKRPAEVFGQPTCVGERELSDIQIMHWCPYTNSKCYKQSRLIDYPMGVCSVYYKDNVIALCPRRFLQDGLIINDIADHYFGSRNNLLLFEEVNLQDVGTFDYVLVKHRPLSSDIDDFIMVEFQTAQTTGTGSLVKSLVDYMELKNIGNESYNFGLNLADIWKRTFTQILNKGIVAENWGHKIYWVVQEPIYQNFLDRYNLNGMEYNALNSAVFSTYDLRLDNDRYVLFRTRLESSTTDDLFNAFRNNPNIPSKDAFLKKLKHKIRARMELKL